MDDPFAKAAEDAQDAVRLAWVNKTPAERGNVAWGLSMARDMAMLAWEFLRAAPPPLPDAVLAMEGVFVSLQQLIEVLLENVDLDAVFPEGVPFMVRADE